MIVNKYNTGGGSASGVTPEQVQEQITSALTPYWESGETKDYVDGAVSGIDLSNYYTSAQTESAITEAVAGKADKKILVDFDRTPQSERAALYATLKGLYDGGSGATINKNYDFYKTVNTWQGLKIDYYGFSGDTMVFGKVVSPENTADQVVYEQVLTIDSLGNVAVVTNIVGGGADMSEYYTSAETENAIAQAVSGLATEQYVQDALSGVSLEGYATSGDMQSAFTLISETQQVAAAGLNQLEGRIDELSGSSVDLSAYWTSAETKNYVDTEVVSARTDVTNAFNMFYNTYIHPVEETVDTLSGAMPDMSRYTPTSGFSTINGSAITDGGNIVIEGGAAPDMSAYYTSAQTEEAISAATSGKADAVNITANTNKFYFPKWNNQGVVDGYVISEMKLKSLFLNGDNKVILGQSPSSIKIWAPEVSGNPGEIVVSTGNGAPVWSAVTFPDVSNYVTSAQVETQIVEKNYVNSGDVKSQVEAYNYATVSQIPTVPTSNTAFTNDAGYITSAATENMVTSTSVSTIWKGTQAEYDAIVDKDPNTFYIIVNN